VVETIIDLVIEGDILFRFHEANKLQPSVSPPTNNLAIASKKMPVFLTIFAFAQYVQANAASFFLVRLYDFHSIFQLGMALDAVYARNTLQFFALT
jgi:hypothetical protein